MHRLAGASRELDAETAQLERIMREGEAGLPIEEQPDTASDYVIEEKRSALEPATSGNPEHNHSSHKLQNVYYNTRLFSLTTPSAWCYLHSKI